MKLVFKYSHPQTSEVTSFTFMPEKPLTWIAGQSIKLELAGPYGPIEHRFTIASPPSGEIITITTRVSDSDYKQALASLKPGDEADGYGIEGDFVWRESRDQIAPHVFVAAGIGITAFYAMLAERAHQKKLINAQLIYGSSAEPVYKTELEQWLQPTYILDRRLTVDDIPKTDGLIYISGPSAMVDELSAALIARGTPEQQIVRDWFTGNLPPNG